MDRLWDFFVDSMMAFFMPLVCSYFTLSANLFLNVSARDAGGLEWVGNTLLSPVQYLLAGREAIAKPDGTWEFIQRFDYQSGFWVKATGSVFALPASILLGTTAKGLSFLTAPTRHRFAAMREAKNSVEIHSHLEKYRKWGLDARPSSDLFIPLGHARRPGDESVLAIEKKAMCDITTLFNEAKIPWWVDCGTCLGVYRYGGAIPWDGDIDLAVLQDDFANICRILNKLDPKKYLVQDWSTRDHPDSFIKVYIRESATMIDIYHFAIDPEARELRYVFSLETNMFFPEWFKIRERRFKEPIAFESVFPLKKAYFDGFEVFVPREIKKYLQRCFGENLDPVKIFNPTTGCYEKDLSHPYWQKAYVH